MVCHCILKCTGSGTLTFNITQKSTLRNLLKHIFVACAVWEKEFLLLLLVLVASKVDDVTNDMCVFSPYCNIAFFYFILFSYLPDWLAFENVKHVEQEPSISNKILYNLNSV